MLVEPVELMCPSHESLKGAREVSDFLGVLEACRRICSLREGQGVRLKYTKVWLEMVFVKGGKTDSLLVK